MEGTLISHPGLRSSRVPASQEAYLLAQNFWCISDTANNTHTTSVRYSGSQLRACSDVHPGKQDGVLDAEELSQRGSDGGHCGDRMKGGRKIIHRPLPTAVSLYTMP